MPKMSVYRAGAFCAAAAALAFLPGCGQKISPQEYTREVQKIYQDKTLSPDQRAQELGALQAGHPEFGSGAAGGTLALGSIVGLVVAAVLVVFLVAMRRKPTEGLVLVGEALAPGAPVTPVQSTAEAVDFASMNKATEGVPTDQLAAEAMPAEKRGVSFFSGCPVSIDHRVKTSVIVGGQSREVWVTPAEAKAQTQGKLMMVRSFTSEDVTMPWYQFTTYDPYRDYIALENMGWKDFNETVTAGLMRLEDVDAKLTGYDAPEPEAQDQPAEQHEQAEEAPVEPQEEDQPDEAAGNDDPPAQAGG